MLNISAKKIIAIVIFFGIALAGYKVFAYLSDPKEVLDFSGIHKNILIDDNGFAFEAVSSAKTAGEALKENGIALGEYDRVLPEESAPLAPGSKIEIRRSANIRIEVDGKKIEAHTLQKNLLFAVLESGVNLGALDIIEPNQNYLPKDGLVVRVTRINVEEKKVEEKLDFKTIEKTDSKLGWREKKIEQPGEKGVREVLYKITYKDGKETSRVVLKSSVIKDPVTEILVKGTYVKYGKSHEGQGTWYAWKGGMYAANPWLPMGSYVKVTNRANGKSVIVQINDRGPFGNGRIIDLDKVAFQKIASLGAGVIDVKMEEILN